MRLVHFPLAPSPLLTCSLSHQKGERERERKGLKVPPLSVASLSPRSTYYKVSQKKVFRNTDIVSILISNISNTIQLCNLKLGFFKSQLKCVGSFFLLAHPVDTMASSSSSSSSSVLSSLGTFDFDISDSFPPSSPPSFSFNPDIDNCETECYTLSFHTWCACHLRQETVIPTRHLLLLLEDIPNGCWFLLVSFM